MGSALQPQLLKLEEAFDEAKRAGVAIMAIQEEVKVWSPAYPCQPAAFRRDDLHGAQGMSGEVGQGPAALVAFGFHR